MHNSCFPCGAAPSCRGNDVFPPAPAVETTCVHACVRRQSFSVIPSNTCGDFKGFKGFKGSKDFKDFKDFEDFEAPHACQHKIECGGGAAALKPPKPVAETMLLKCM